MSRSVLIVGNWKMYKTIAEGLDLATTVKNAVAPTVRGRDVSVVIAPPFTSLYPIAKRLEGSTVALAAQDCYWEGQGAFTGEVSATMLADVGCRYVIIGHSERRQLFGETDAAVNLKAKAALKAGLSPIVCVGETAKERDAGEMRSRIMSQLAEGLFGFTPELLERTVIAYEPVWAIGTGRVATTDQAQEVHALIRQYLHSQLGEVARSVRILYGGSVKPNNIAGLMAQPDVDGALVGGASLRAEEFLQIVRFHEAPATS
ncbi:MAG: triose-phosphate isomerase [Myxococcales bacterium]|nr:triose-phosphate isomerase [Myxococcales bacterium]